MSQAEDHNEQIIKDFPTLFNDGTPNYDRIRVSVGRGWNDLVRDTLQEIHDYVEQNKIEQPVGGRPIVAQIKEKFGELTIYLGVFSPELNSILQKASSRSRTICEKCGEPGYVRAAGYGYYVQALCDKHDKNNERTNT